MLVLVEFLIIFLVMMVWVDEVFSVVVSRVGNSFFVCILFFWRVGIVGFRVVGWWLFVRDGRLRNMLLLWGCLVW